MDPGKSLKQLLAEYDSSSDSVKKNMSDEVIRAETFKKKVIKDVAAVGEIPGLAALTMASGSFLCNICNCHVTVVSKCNVDGRYHIDIKDKHRKIE